MKQNLLTKVLLLFALIVGSSSAWAQNEIKSPNDVVSGKAYYIKGVYTSSGSEYTMYYGPTENDVAGTKVTSAAVSDIAAAMPITFTHVEGGWTLQTPNGNYIRPHTSNGQSYFVDEAVVMQLASGKTKEGEGKGIKIGPYDSSWYFQANTTTNKIGAYKNTQWDVTLIEVVENTDAESSFTFTNNAPSITLPSTSTYTGAYTVATGYNGTISFEITDNTAGATINTATGMVTVAHEGSVTVKGTASAVSGSFKASSDSYTLTVTDSRQDAGLAYDASSQTVNVDEVLSAPELTNPYNLTVSYSSSDEAIATVDEVGNVTGIAAGTAIITAEFAGNNDYAPGSASYTIIVKNAGNLFYEGVSGYTGTSDVSSELSTTYDNLDSDQWESFSRVYAGKKLNGDSNGHLKFGSGSYAGKAVTKSIPLIGNGKLTYKVQRYDSSNTGNLKITVEGANAVGDLDVTGTGSWVEKTVKLTGAEGNVVITFETTSNNKRIRVDDILLVEVTTESATIAESGYTTFCSPFDLSFENVGGLNAAYVVSQSTDAVATLKRVTAVPAGTGVVLKGTTGSVIIPVVEYTGDVISNLLEGTLEETTVGAETVYVVSGGKFMLFAGTSIPAGKAYLPVSAIGEGAPSLSFEFDDETTSIQNIERTIMDNQYYSLDGRRVAQPTKGLYILNGRKVIVK